MSRRKSHSRGRSGLRWTRWVAGLLLGFGGLLVAGGIWLWSAAGWVYDDQDTVDGVHLPRVDAIVCLAGGRGRIAAAGDLWYRYWEQRRIGRESLQKEADFRPILYFSGLGEKTGWATVQQQLRAGVTEVISPADTVLETESRNTEGNAQWLLQYARERGWKSILLVTSRYHMRRARLIFERLAERDRQLRAGLRAEGAPAPETLRIETLSVYQEPFEPGEWSGDLQGIRVTLTEYFKSIYYRRFWSPVLWPMLPGAMPSS